MAYLVEKFCTKCNVKFLWNDNNYTEAKCPYCEKKQAEIAEETYINNLKVLSTEARIERLERWIYNHRANPDILKVPLY